MVAAHETAKASHSGAAEALLALMGHEQPTRLQMGGAMLVAEFVLRANGALTGRK